MNGSQDHVQPPLRQVWTSFKRDCIPAAASPTQRQEMRRAFYAGAHATLLMLQHLDTLPEAVRAEVTELLKGELNTFVATVGTTLEEQL